MEDKTVKAIQHALVDVGLTGKEVAAKAGISDTLFWMIVYGQRKGYRHRGKIARALKTKKSLLFPTVVTAP